MNPGVYDGLGVDWASGGPLPFDRMREVWTVFDSPVSTTYQWPDWAEFADVWCVGGGGSGGSGIGDSFHTADGGSSGGCVLARVSRRQLPALSVSISVGSGGAAAAFASNGNDGGLTSFGGIVNALGGLHGRYDGSSAYGGQAGSGWSVAYGIWVMLGLIGDTSGPGAGGSPSLKVRGFSLPAGRPPLATPGALYIDNGSPGFGFGSSANLTTPTAGGSGAMIIIARRHPSRLTNH